MASTQEKAMTFGGNCTTENCSQNPELASGFTQAWFFYFRHCG